jgi:CHAT domain-containing protein
LYYLPFHALFDGNRYVVDEHPLWYVPSASVFHLCCQRERKHHRQSLIVAVSNESVPEAVEEVRAVASVVPNPHLLLGEAATEAGLRTLGPSSGLLHVVAKGQFRGDSPMFSSISLSDSRLSLLDLYGLDLSAELVTLSGCGTGFGATEGEELMGLGRGLLHAGAQAVLLPLWNTARASTRDFMAAFYSCLQSTPDKSLAFRFATLRLRQTRPHPFDWASYVLVGQAV